MVPGRFYGAWTRKTVLGSVRRLLRRDWRGNVLLVSRFHDRDDGTAGRADFTLAEAPCSASGAPVYVSAYLCRAVRAGQRHAGCAVSTSGTFDDRHIVQQNVRPSPADGYPHVPD